MIKAGRRPQHEGEIGSVETALALLDLFECAQAVRVTDVSKALAISSSSAHRLLLTFARHGFVLQEHSHGEYTIGPKLARLAASLSMRMDVLTATRSLMTDVALELGETVGVAVLNGVNVTFVGALDSSRDGAPSIPKNMTLATHASAAGKALIAEFRRAEIERLYPSESLQQFTSKTLPSRESLLRDLERTRIRGYAVHAEEIHPNLTAYACPIRDRFGAARAALVVVGPSRRFRRYAPERIAATLSAAAGAAGFGQLLPQSGEEAVSN